MGSTPSSLHVVHPISHYDAWTHQLVLHVLPVLDRVAKQLESRFKKRDKRWAFLQTFSTAATLLYDQLNAIQEADVMNDYAKETQSLAQVLERLVNGAIIEMVQLEPVETELYPRLNAIHKLFPQGYEELDKMRGIQLILLTRRSSDWEELQSTLSRLTDEFQQFGEDVTLARTFTEPSTHPEGAEDIRRFAERIHSALACDSCGIESQREARLKLDTFRARYQNTDCEGLCVLFARSSPGDTWHEVFVHNTQLAGQPKHMQGVRFELPGKPDVQSHNWRSSTPKQFPCICETLKGQSTVVSDGCRLHIAMDSENGAVHVHVPESDRKYPQVSSQQQRTLKALLENSGSEWNEFIKLVLAVVVAYSLFYLYDGSWANGRWGRDNIIFFLEGNRIPLRPFLSSDPLHDKGPLVDLDGQHRYPEFLELGLILLEINLGQSLESFNRSDKITDYDELWLTACRVFKLRRLRIPSQAHRDAIDKCLAADFKMTGTCNPQELRDSLFEMIVKPLEEELMRNFKEELLSQSLKSLDEVAENKIDLATMAARDPSASFSSNYLVNESTGKKGVSRSMMQSQHEDALPSDEIPVREPTTNDTPSNSNTATFGAQNGGTQLGQVTAPYSVFNFFASKVV